MKSILDKIFEINDECKKSKNDIVYLKKKIKKFDKKITEIIKRNHIIDNKKFILKNIKNFLFRETGNLPILIVLITCLFSIHEWILLKILG